MGDRQTYAMQRELGCSGSWSRKGRGEGENGREGRKAEIASPEEGQTESEKGGTGEEVGDHPACLSRRGEERLSLFYNKKAGS